MDIGEELKSLGYIKSHISLEWTSTPDDDVPEDYQLYTAGLFLQIIKNQIYTYCLG